MIQEPPRQRDNFKVSGFHADETALTISSLGFCFEVQSDVLRPSIHVTSYERLYGVKEDSQHDEEWNKFEVH